jgi:alpha-beta hydrolase superfamily lysophospholipase
MVATLLSGALKILLWGLALIGLAALVLGGLIAVPVPRLPMLESISRTARAVDRSDMPAADHFQARDGTTLAVRHYPPRKPGVTQIAVLVHGSSGSSIAVHALARALADHGVETFAPDIRGHGQSGSRGDIAYLGQLDDDLADLVTEIRKSHPAAPLTLIGHSAGGGFALRVAASPIQNLFARTVLLAPYLGYNAPTGRPDSGGWARADLPRVLALVALRRLGLPWAESLPTLAFAVPPDSVAFLTETYSFRLMRNFAVSGDFRDDFAAAIRPIAIFAGAADELMFSEKYQEAVGDRATVRVIGGVNHMGIVSDPAAVAVIADDVAKYDAGT